MGGTCPEWPSDFITHGSYGPVNWQKPQISTQTPAAAEQQTQDMTLKQQLGPVIHPGSVWKHWSLKSESIWWQHGPKQHQVSSLESAWSSMSTRTMNINTDPVCNMAMNTDMTPISLLSYTTQNLLSGLTPCTVA